MGAGKCYVQEQVQAAQTWTELGDAVKLCSLLPDPKGMISLELAKAAESAWLAAIDCEDCITHACG